MTAVFLLLLMALSTPATPGYSAQVDRAWTILKDGAADKDAGKRAKAVHALGLCPKVQLAESIAQKALADSNKDVRAEAANALGHMGAMSARPRLRLALQDKEVKVVIASANALYELKDPTAYEVYYALLTGDRKSSSGLIQSQLDMLRDRKQLAKLMLETGIGFVPFGGMGYETWKTITHDDSSPVRALAAERLAHDPDPKSADALKITCTDKKWQVRVAVVDAIAERGDSRLLDPILPLLEDDNDNVRYETAGAIVRLTSPYARRSRR